VPTETVWGLACGLAHAAALFGLKGRDSSKPAALAFPDASSVRESGLCRWTPEAGRLALKFWPGPLTLVLPGAGKTLPPELAGSEGGVGFRVPDHPEALALLRLAGEPLVLSSANLSGGPTPSGPFPDGLFPELARLSGRVEPGSPPSTVVSLLPELKILRAGRIAETDILACLREPRP
jgi:L-threonylcarbamoyladenylate synthase